MAISGKRSATSGNVLGVVGETASPDDGGGWSCLASASFAPSAHAHDDRYYTETEMGTSGSASLHWENLASVPTGFAGGVDDDTT